MDFSAAESVLKITVLPSPPGVNQAFPMHDSLNKKFLVRLPNLDFRRAADAKRAQTFNLAPVTQT